MTEEPACIFSHSATAKLPELSLPENQDRFNAGNSWGDVLKYVVKAAAPFSPIQPEFLVSYTLSADTVASDTSSLKVDLSDSSLKSLVLKVIGSTLKLQTDVPLDVSIVATRAVVSRLG